MREAAADLARRLSASRAHAVTGWHAEAGPFTGELRLTGAGQRKLARAARRRHDTGTAEQSP